MRSDDLNLTDSDSFGSMESLDSVEASVDEKASINNTVDQKAVDHNTDNHKITEAFIAPHVCLVGATNVGKSTLFNKLVGFRSAIVCDRPGVTVDFHEKTSLSSPLGFPVKIVDTGGVRLLKNDRRVKKGPNREAEKKNETLLEETELAAKKAIDRSDVLFFVVDGTRDPGPVEDEIAQWLRRNAPCSLENIAILVNKSDVKKFDPHIFYSCLLYTSPSPRDLLGSRMPSSA